LAKGSTSYHTVVSNLLIRVSILLKSISLGASLAVNLGGTRVTHIWASITSLSSRVQEDTSKAASI
jgi:hypothetical protein